MFDVFLRDVVRRTTVRVNISSTGEQANADSRLPNSFSGKVSDGGRYVLFNSDASNLVPGDTNDAEDLFVRDLVRGTTERVTVNTEGEQADGEVLPTAQDAVFGGIVTGISAFAFGVYTLSELNHSMTADGRYVFLSSGATNLVPEDENGTQRDIFVRDRVRGTTTLVSVSSSGVQGNASSNAPVTNGDGSVVAFLSSATNLEDEAESPAPGLALATYMRTIPR